MVEKRLVFHSLETIFVECLFVDFRGKRLFGNKAWVISASNKIKLKRWAFVSCWYVQPHFHLSSERDHRQDLAAGGGTFWKYSIGCMQQLVGRPLRWRRPCFRDTSSQRWAFELSFYSHLFSSVAKNFVWEGPVSDVVSRWRLSNSWKLTWSASKNPSMFVSGGRHDLLGFIIAAALHLLSSTVYCKMNDLSWQRINTTFPKLVYSNFICFLVLTLFDQGAHHI